MRPFLKWVRTPLMTAGGSSDGTYNGVWPLEPRFWNNNANENFAAIVGGLINWAEELATRNSTAFKGLYGITPMAGRWDPNQNAQTCMHACLVPNLYSGLSRSHPSPEPCPCDYSGHGFGGGVGVWGDAVFGQGRKGGGMGQG